MGIELLTFLVSSDNKLFTPSYWLQKKISTFVLELDFINNMPNQNEVVLVCIHYARITIIYLQHGFLFLYHNPQIPNF